MRALELSYPWGAANLRLVEHADPRPGFGEVVVRMRAVSLNFRDAVITAQGGYVPMDEQTSPIVPFSDGCGIVEAIGDGVTRVGVGDRVSTQFFPNWTAGRPTPEKIATVPGSAGSPGSGRELALLSENAVSRVPDFLTDQEVATLPCAALTAWRAMFVDAQLTPGDTVVLQGTGGVSIFALQFAHAAGYRTIITSSSDEKLGRAQALGADVLVNYKKEPQWSQSVRQATGGQGADLIVDVGGASTLNQSLQCIRMGGHIAVVGLLSGAQSEASVSPAQLMGLAVKVQGLSVGSREMFEAMCRTVELHRMRPVISRTMPWTDAARAIGEMMSGDHFGKVVLTFD